MSTLIQLTGYQAQRLQIFTALCIHEEFCQKNEVVDGILHLLVSCLSDKQLIYPGARLIGSFSTHATGCQILSENGVIELFTQLFLSSSSGDTATSHTILRNFAKNGGDIPQGSLIVSCLMQDMIYDPMRKPQIMDTIVSLVKTMPCAVQEHDLERIVVSQITQGQPLLSFLSLELFKVCDIQALRNIYPRVLGAIYKMLNTKENMYPQLIEISLEVLTRIHEQYDIGEFLRKTEIIGFVEKFLALMPATDKRIDHIRELSHTVCA